MESSLSFRARLVHAEAGSRVVQLSAWRGSSCLGSALGEAENAELAEDRALEKLQARLNQQPAASAAAPSPQEVEAPPVRHPVVRRPPADDPVAPTAEAAPTPDAPPAAPAETVQPSLSTPPAVEPQEPVADPEDWSDELAEIEVQLKRLGWDRTQEGTYLQRAFGHPSRNRITSYADLASYVRSLRALNAGSDSATAEIPLQRSQLLQQNDELLKALNWGSREGRKFLEQEYKLSSRQQLNDPQLLEFNLKLENAALRGDLN
ncbi:MAG: hypothetical protein QUV04_08690 [Synechococcus sp. WH 8007]|nr:hypothetical protein [Synechococcus sp. WH 8007]